MDFLLQLHVYAWRIKPFGLAIFVFTTWIEHRTEIDFHIDR